MKNLTQKNFFATCVIKFLQNNDTIEDLEYEDLINHMNQIEPPDGINIGVNVLNKHAAYIVEQNEPVAGTELALVAGTALVVANRGALVLMLDFCDLSVQFHPYLW